MTIMQGLDLLNYGLVLIYGLLLSTWISGGCTTQREKWLVRLACPVFLLLQAICSAIWGVGTVQRLYPLMIHLPLLLILTLELKKPFWSALISVCTAYLCCQLPRWISLLFALAGSELVSKLGYTLSIIPICLLLRRKFVPAAREAMNYSKQNLFLFGSLPLLYYAFDYAAVIYSDALYTGIPALIESLPTALIAFYVLFLTAYHHQTQRRTQAELQQSILEAELKQSGEQIEDLRRLETQAAIYQHDMRHHLAILEGYIAAGKPDQAQEYIRKVQQDVQTLAQKHFCENEPVNLLCSSFSTKAERMGIHFAVKASLPPSLSLPDTELCSLISNALENAFHAVRNLPQQMRWVEFSAEIRRNKLLIEVRNPYSGELPMRDGLPITTEKGHGYGCISIRSIVQKNGGLSSFQPSNGIFTMRVILPAAKGANHAD